jgi:septal ring factor EnvC (AmiA/AmiB activator)
MKGWKLGAAAFALLASLAFGAPPPAVAEAAKIAESAGELEAWRTKVREARDRVRAARSELEAAEYDYASWRKRQRPRGTPKAEIVARIASAEREVAAAEAALPDVVGQARRAGLPPGDFRALEIEN